MLALALPVLLMSRDDFARRPVLSAAAVVAVRLLPAAVGGQLPHAVPRARADVAAGVRAGAARVPAAGERRSGAQVPGAGRHGDRDVPDGRVAAVRRQRLARARRVRARRSTAARPMARAAVVLVVVAFFLKAAIVPFHAWAPDAYEGASIPVTAYMATIIKAGRAAGGAAPVRHGAASTGRWSDLLALLPLVSIVWGNLDRDAAAELPADDRVLVDRARRLPVLRVPRRRTGPLPGGRVLPARLRR